MFQRRPNTPAVLCCAILALCSAPSIAARSSSGASIASATAGGLESALEAIRTEKIKADIYFIAGDHMGGRDTPSEGLRIVARFLRRTLAEHGFEPGTPDGYFHEYPLTHKLMDEASTLSVSIAGTQRELLYGYSWFLGSKSELLTASTEGPVVFCGAGERGDFEAAEGAWALCLDSSVSVMRRRNSAKKAGALGVVVVPGPDYEGLPYPERFERALADTRRGLVRWPDERRRSTPRLPELYLHEGVGAELLAALERGDEVRLSEDRRAERVIQLENVCGFWPGSDLLLEKEVILVTAHYDHVGYQGGQVHPGADDNGSGTTALLALADALKRYGPMRRSVMLIWVSGEEKGLWGSQAWAENPTLPEGYRAVAGINLDMVGRNDPKELLITPTKKLKDSYNGLTRLAEELCVLEGFEQLGSADDYWLRSDHYNFAKLGIPVTFLFADIHEDYHKPGDTPEKVDCDKVRRVSRLVMRMLDGMQDDVLSL